MGEAAEREVTETILDNILTRPFIEFLGKFIAFGADPQAKVGKLKKFREENRVKTLREMAEQSKQDKEVKKRHEILH